MNTEFCGFFGLVQEKIEIGNHGFYFSTSKYTRSGKKPRVSRRFSTKSGKSRSSPNSFSEDTDWICYLPWICYNLLLQNKKQCRTKDMGYLHPY